MSASASLPRADISGFVENDGAVTTGDGTVGIRAGTLYRTDGYGGVVVQGEDGAVSTGDHSIGIQVAGNLYSWPSTMALFRPATIRSVSMSTAAEPKPYLSGMNGITRLTLPIPYFYYTRETVTSNAEELRVANSGIIESGDN